MPERELRFEFGKNWNSFIQKHFSDAMVNDARTALLDFLGIPALKGMSFLDIGCGSGLSSLAALRAGASRIMSFDYDPESVRTAERLHRYAGSPPHWTVRQGSVLDEGFVRSLGTYDVVYSWGVLHHTGDWRTALANARVPLHADSLLFVALYSSTASENNTVFGQPSPEEWLEIKKKYVESGKTTRNRMVAQYIWRRYFAAAGANPLRLIRCLGDLCSRWKGYSKTSRGMNFFTDIRDWLGGWPMEFVSETQCLDMAGRNLDLGLLRMRTGCANTEYLFQPRGANTFWNDKVRARRPTPLLPPYERISSKVWRATLPGLPELKMQADTEAAPLRSPLRLLENDIPLPFAHCHRPALSLGKGRYRHEETGLLFCTSDDTDPAENGRAYAWYLDT